jgi:hypothetical protein
LIKANAEGGNGGELQVRERRKSYAKGAKEDKNKMQNEINENTSSVPTFFRGERAV